MILFRPALWGLALSSALAGPALAVDSLGSAEPCDVVCQMQAYLNSDHMVTMVPNPKAAAKVELATPTRKTGSVKRQPEKALAATRKRPATMAALPHAVREAKIAPLSPIVRPEPARTAQLALPAAAAVPQPRAQIGSMTDANIPGSVPRMTVTQFAGARVQASTP